MTAAPTVLLCTICSALVKHPNMTKYGVAEILRKRREERALPQVWVDPTRCVVGVWDRNEVVAREELLDKGLMSRRANLVS